MRKLRLQAACVVRNSLIRNVDPDSVISWPGNRDPQSRKRPFLGRIFCSLERGGWMTPRGGCRPAEPPRSRKIFSIFGLRNFGLSARFRLKKLSVWPILGGFLSNGATCRHVRSVHQLLWCPQYVDNQSGQKTTTNLTCGLPVPVSQTYLSLDGTPKEMFLSTKFIQSCLCFSI